MRIRVWSYMVVADLCVYDISLTGPPRCSCPRLPLSVFLSWFSIMYQLQSQDRSRLCGTPGGPRMLRRAAVGVDRYEQELCASLHRTHERGRRGHHGSGADRAVREDEKHE